MKSRRVMCVARKVEVRKACTHTHTHTYIYIYNFYRNTRSKILAKCRHRWEDNEEIYLTKYNMGNGTDMTGVRLNDTFFEHGVEAFGSIKAGYTLSS
jgi:hypothetical protein